MLDGVEKHLAGGTRCAVLSGREEAGERGSRQITMAESAVQDFEAEPAMLRGEAHDAWFQLYMRRDRVLRLLYAVCKVRMIC